MMWNNLMPNVLELKNLSSGYWEKKKEIMVTKPVSYVFAEGQLVSLIGPNGVGKSSLLRTIGGLQPAMSGETYVNDKSIAKMTPHQISECVSYVSSATDVRPNFTVAEYVCLGVYRLTDWTGRMKSMKDNDMDSTLEMLSLKAMRDRKVSNLSDGEFQKVKIARAVVQQTPVILLDEPTSHLDFPSRMDIMWLLRELAENQKKLVLVCTHEIDLALKYSDVVCSITKDGNVGFANDVTFRQLNVLFDTTVFHA